MAGKEQGSIRQQYSAATKTRIIDAATKVFTERGFHKATTKVISETAGISEGAIYHYFSSKRDLLVAVIDGITGGTEEGIKSGIVPTGDFRTVYSAMVKERLKRVQPQSATFFSLMSDILNDSYLLKEMYGKMFLPAITIAEELIQKSVDNGNIRPLDIPITARLIYSLAFGIDVLYMMGDEVIQSELENADNIAENLITLILDGISTDNIPSSKKDTS